MKKNILSWLPVLLWCSLIYYLSSLPHLKTELGVWDLVLRKIAHVTEYAVLFLLVRRAVSHTASSRRTPFVHTVAVIFSVLYAASDEYHQSFVPGRGPSVVDVGIDTAGVMTGLLLWWMWEHLPVRYQRVRFFNKLQECIIKEPN
ncbi:MAG: hypothetical protein A2293_00590 [Elusimicrobia bacterium RIFOXYB2_FULL_49_7]|nr:MAG: hypothetical protein A2293_00590 [Elusimicrobia bacterium RIFOXYB2_FULL_49_7]